MKIPFLQHIDPVQQKFAALLDRYEQPIYWHIRRLVGNHNDAEDVMQETFIRAYRNLKQQKEEGSEKAWLYRIATNEALRWLERERNRSAESLNDTADAIQLEAQASTSESAILKAFSQAIATLPPKQQAAFNLRYYDEMDYPEIATALDCSVATARVNYHNAKEKIKNYLLEYETI